MSAGGPRLHTELHGTGNQGRKTGPTQEQVFLMPEKREKKKKRGRPDSKRCQRDGRGREVRMLANGLLDEAGPFQSRAALSNLEFHPWLR